jgi:hypothetical protein
MKQAQALRGQARGSAVTHRVNSRLRDSARARDRLVDLLFSNASKWEATIKYEKLGLFGTQLSAITTEGVKFLGQLRRPRRVDFRFLAGETQCPRRGAWSSSRSRLSWAC